MTEHLQHGSHLDADLLAAFAEGALAEHEREACLLHLAGCAECRHVLFLAQGPVEEAVPAPTPVLTMPAPFWRRLAPLAYAAALAACLVTGFFVLRPQHPAAPPVDVSRNVPPPASDVAAPPERVEAPVAAPPPTQSKRRQPAAQAKVAADGVRGNEDTAASASTERKAVATDQVAAAPAPMAPAGAGASGEVLPLNNRNVLQQAAPQPAANAAVAAEQRRVAAAPGLRIEHGEDYVGLLAKVSGAVHDPSGATVPGATVTLQQAAGAPRLAKTDAQGNFAFGGLPAGHYELQIVAPGFSTVRRSLDLKANDVALLDSQLPLGATSETVQVSAADAAVQTESASVANMVVRPSGPAMESTAVQGKRVLGVDAAGVVYLSTDRGRRWKRVKAVWVGKVIRIAASGDGFEMGTDSGVVWVSGDGKHWRLR